MCCTRTTVALASLTADAARLSPETGELLGLDSDRLLRRSAAFTGRRLMLILTLLSSDAR